MSPEPGSPLLAAAEGEGVEIFADLAGLAHRLHGLRRGAGLDCEPGHASTGGDAFPGVLIWARPGRADPQGPRRFLGFAAGAGADTPQRLLSALSESARRQAA